MKKIKYLSVLLLFITLACSDDGTDTVPTDFVGSWSGEMSCPASPISLNINMNIQADQARCDACYTVEFFMDGPEEAMPATVTNGELVVDTYIIDEGSSEDAVSLDSKGRLTSDGKLAFDFTLREMSGDNFSFTCTSTLTSQ